MFWVVERQMKSDECFAPEIILFLGIVWPQFERCNYNQFRVRSCSYVTINDHCAPSSTMWHEWKSEASPHNNNKQFSYWPNAKRWKCIENVIKKLMTPSKNWEQKKLNVSRGSASHSLALSHSLQSAIVLMLVNLCHSRCPICYVCVAWYHFQDTNSIIEVIINRFFANANFIHLTSDINHSIDP